MLQLHPESLLNIALVRDALSDRNFRIQPRAVDAEWAYQKVIPINVSGFNPFLSTYFHAQNSLVAQWLKNPTRSSRPLNEADLLVKEIFFLVHDSLHQWAYRCIHSLLPKHSFGKVPITRKNFDDHVFFHLLTEATATVGLDYWFLCTIQLNEICDIGSSFKSLTVSYREEDEPEYRRFNPSFSAQKPEFFETLTRFYCDGVFPGFTLEDMRQSPRLLAWLKHELSYGETQREYTRGWFSFLCADDLVLSQEELQAPIEVSSKWRKRLIQDMGELLWKKVKLGEEKPVLKRFDPCAIWEGAKKKEPDFRFLNLNMRDPAQSAREILAGRYPDRNFKFFFYQYVSSFDHESFDKELIKLFPTLIKDKDFQLIEHLFKNQKRVSPVRGEPEHLFILN